MSYFFVPLPNDVCCQSHRNVRHDNIGSYVRFILGFRTIEPVHIGGGGRSLRDSNIVREGARVMGRPGIPGSSLKGVIRSRLEAITKSCGVSLPKKRPRLVGAYVSRSFQGYEVEFDHEISKIPNFHPCDSTRCCMTCSLFGATRWKGRVRVQDHVSEQGSNFAIVKMPQVYSPRPHHLGTFDVDESNRVLRVTKLHGRKFYADGNHDNDATTSHLVEAIPGKSFLQGEIVVANPTKSELGSLLSAFGHTPRSPLRVGAAKGYGFGLIEVERLEVKRRTGSSESVVATEQMDEWRNAFVQSSDYWCDGERALSGVRTAEHEVKR